MIAIGTEVEEEAASVALHELFQSMRNQHAFRNRATLCAPPPPPPPLSAVSQFQKGAQ